jgi:hypothetical protein
MYELKKQKKEGNFVNYDSNNPNYLGKIITSFILFMTVSVGFGFLIGHFVFPKSCKGCKTVVEEVRTEGNAYIDFVSGTEYIANIGALDQGQVIVRVVDYKGNPLNATCNATILNPNKSYYISSQTMTPSTIQGNYYITFTIPTQTGIFEDYVNCSIQLGSKIVYGTKASSFHVSPVLTLFNNISTQITQLNQTVVDGDLMLNNTINYVHTDIINHINNTESSLNATLTTIINNMATYYSNLVMITNNQTTTILNALDDCCDDVLAEIGKYRSDIEIIKEWLSYMFGKITPTTRDVGESWIDKIVGRDVELPDWEIPRPN